MSQFVISPCTLADADDMANLYIRAFTGTHINNYIYPPATCSAENLFPWLQARFRKQISQILPTLYHFKVTDRETGKPVAWSRWGYPYSLSQKEKEKHDAEKMWDIVDPAKKWPVGANQEACEAYFGTMDQMREKHVVWEEDYILYFLATDPDYHRRGLATLLLRQGIALADRDEKRIYLESTEAGHPLYESLGWEDMDTISIDFKKWGGERPGINYVMRREPNARGRITLLSGG